MRWASLLTTLALAGGSLVLPRLLGRATGIDAQSLGAMLQQVTAADSGEAVDAEVTRQWQALQGGRLEDVPLERLAAVQGLPQGAGAGTRDVAAALAGALQNQKPLSQEWRASLLRDSEKLRRFYRRERPRFLAGLLLGGVIVLLSAVLGAVPCLRGAARFVMGMAFGLSGRFLILASLAATAYFAASRLNPWPLLPFEVLAAPVGTMLLSGLFLRLLDPNYPVWNTMLASFAAPVAASLGVWCWLTFSPGVLA